MEMVTLLEIKDEDIVSTSKENLEKFTRELHRLTTCVKISSQAEKARFPFQEIYMLRGKVDNIYDMSLAEISKIDIIDDLSRIIGLVPGKNGHINQDRILGFTDADQMWVCL